MRSPPTSVRLAGASLVRNPETRLSDALTRDGLTRRGAGVVSVVDWSTRLYKPMSYSGGAETTTRSFQGQRSKGLSTKGLFFFIQCIVTIVSALLHAPHQECPLTRQEDLGSSSWHDCKLLKRL